MLRAYNNYQQQQANGQSAPLTVAGAVSGSVQGAPAAGTEDQSISPLAAMTGGDVEYTVRERNKERTDGDDIPERDQARGVSSEREKEVLTLLEDVMDDVVKIVEGRGKTPENVKRMTEEAETKKQKVRIISIYTHIETFYLP